MCTVTLPVLRIWGTVTDYVWFCHSCTTYIRICTYVCMYVCMHNYNALKAATVVVFVHCALYTSQDYVRMYVSSPVYSQTPDLPCLLHPPPYLLALFVGATAVPSPPAEAGRAHVPLLHDTGKWDRCHVPPAHWGDDGALPQASKWLILLQHLLFSIFMIAQWVIHCLDSLMIHTCVICIVLELMRMEPLWIFGRCTEVMHFYTHHSTLYGEHIFVFLYMLVCGLQLHCSISVTSCVHLWPV